MHQYRQGVPHRFSCLHGKSIQPVGHVSGIKRAYLSIMHPMTGEKAEPHEVYLVIEDNGTLAFFKTDKTNVYLFAADVLKCAAFETLEEV